MSLPDGTPAPEPTTSIDLTGLNPPQLRATTHPAGPLLIVAGAGSGKTRVLTHRIAWLIREQHVSPYAILAITFTNKAADEMRHRVVQLVGPVAERMWVSTFHAACVRILRRDAPALGYEPSFSIYDQSDSTRLVSYVIRDLDWDTKKFPARTVHAVISAAKNELLDVATYTERSRRSSLYERQIAKIYTQYQQRLLAANAMDFDDLLLLTVRLFQQHPDILEFWQHRFAHVLVDEYQDTNQAQNELVLQLAGVHHQVTVVGDSDQSIYGWRGADIRNILEFEQTFPDTTTVTLDRNYRSTQAILDAANAVIVNNPGRPDKKLWTSAGEGEHLVRYAASDERDEAAWIATETHRLRSQHHHDWGDIAVFYRTNAQSRAIEQALTHNGIPYKVVGGTKFYERKEVKDLLAYLCVVANPGDEVALKRVLNVPRRGIGDTSITRLDTWAAAHNTTFAQAMEHADQAGLNGKALTGINQFLRLLNQLRNKLTSGPEQPDDLGYSDETQQIGPAELLQAILDSTEYLEELKATGGTDIEIEGRLENVQELLGAAQQTPTLTEFLTEVSLVADSDEVDPDSTSVTLMTLHTAKGLEYPVVFITGMEESIFPHFRSLEEPTQMEEERRLCYVGLTRAKQRLYLSYAEHRSLWGRSQSNSTSRFVAEIPEHLLRPRNNSPTQPSPPSSTHFARPVAAPPTPFHSQPTVRPSTPPAGAERLGLVAGEQVVHARYGQGVVVRIGGSGADAEATIKFPGMPEKRFALCMSPLRRP